MIKLNAKELRTTKCDQEEAKKIKKNPIYIILDNVWDTYNVGAIFRLADAVAATKVYLCGETLTPPNTRIKRASINTTEWVTWSYAKTAGEAIKELKNELRTKNLELRTLAVEQSEKSIPLKDLKVELPVAIVVGNETYGVSKEVLEIVDTIVELPMYGVNKSLNVMVSCGIVLYRIIGMIK
ncbi:MAG: tRNA/rRNA methyltransferase [Candidatus Gottesmanbacteria bacterium GW2011_GWC2_39_8]|uniref:tRNA/rRNA methyltransferase n=1 Tax=Candidatus Gottesmanbacteria bacterium GW2011_GWC2_39_8 TaxID=1618450 RepID=A0A0G0T7Z9_9BACT|nr:MAG: tRNA/rRNA methyltransferase [Candidatus Gottesmanbacteria bacterium GW2011_GWC2_39_8]